MGRAVAVALLFVSTAIWGLSFVFQKGAMEHMGPLTFAGARYLIGATLVLPLGLLEYRRAVAAGTVVTGRQWLRIGALCLAFFLGAWLQQAGLGSTTVTNGGFISALYVIFTPIAAYVLFRAKPHPVVLVGAPLAMLGIYLLTGARLDHFVTGDLQILLCAVCWGVQVAVLGRLVVETRMPVFLSTIAFLATGVLSSAGAAVIEAPQLDAVLAGWVPILYAAIGSTAIAFTLQAVAQRHVPPSNTAIIMSSEAVFAGLFGAWLLQERLPAPGYAGAGLILLAIVMVELVPRLAVRRARVEPAE